MSTQAKLPNRVSGVGGCGATGSASAGLSVGLSADVVH